MRVRVTFDQARLDAEMRKERERLRRVAAGTVNNLAFRAQREVRAEMLRVFDRPTPWVLNGMRVIKVGETPWSSKGTREEDAAVRREIVSGNGPIEATLDWRNAFSNADEGVEGGGAIPAAKILRAQIEGGPRRMKRFERALERIGAKPAGWLAVPARDQRLDRYGNLSGGRVTAILSDLQAFREGGYRANRPSGKAGRFFVIATFDAQRRLRPGIYEVQSDAARRRGAAPRLVVAYVRPGSYTPRLFPRLQARFVAETQVAEAFAEAWQKLGRDKEG